LLPHSLQRSRSRIAALADQSASFWKQHGPDREFGGFHGTLDKLGKSVEPSHKGLIAQTRHLWSMSTWFRYREPIASVRALADDLYEFICNSYYVPSSGEYAYLVERNGQTADPKHLLYAQAFTIYAFAEYGRTFASEDACRRALDLFSRIDARAHDAVHGGYRQLDDAPWLSSGAQKETNTHIHLMEAFATLYAATSSPTVKQRLEELIVVVTRKLLQPAGYIHKDFTADWTPVGNAAVSYGHDLETYWLLDDAARVLGRPLDPAILTPARAMAINSGHWGHDAALGGYFEEGPPGGSPNKLEKVWWVQAEALPALFRLFEQTGDETWLARMDGTLTYIENHLLNRACGEWYWGVLPDGSLGPKGDVMGEPWKASYHVLRALLFTEHWIDQWLERSS
jgi:cellobiose epimerase